MQYKMPATVFMKFITKQSHEYEKFHTELEKKKGIPPQPYRPFRSAINRFVESNDLSKGLEYLKSPKPTYTKHRSPNFSWKDQNIKEYKAFIKIIEDNKGKFKKVFPVEKGFMLTTSFEFLEDDLMDDVLTLNLKPSFYTVNRNDKKTFYYVSPSNMESEECKTIIYLAKLALKEMIPHEEVDFKIINTKTGIQQCTGFTRLEPKIHATVKHILLLIFKRADSSDLCKNNFLEEAEVFINFEDLF